MVTFNGAIFKLGNVSTELLVDGCFDSLIDVGKTSEY